MLNSDSKEECDIPKDLTYTKSTAEQEDLLKICRSGK
jgi:hypothetical protein